MWFYVPEDLIIKMHWDKFEEVILINNKDMLFESNAYNGKLEFEKITFKV